LPDAYAELALGAHRLEGYFRDLCDIEFTIEHGKLWMLQARIGKRSPAAAPRIAVELVREGKVGLTKSEAVQRIDKDVLSGVVHVDRLTTTREPIARGVPASPGAATGRAVFDADRAIELAEEEGVDLILVRRETSPEDVHGMSVARGIVTTLGGTLSHAAVVARAWNIPAVCGVEEADLDGQVLRVGNVEIREGDVISIDGDSGAIYLGEVAHSIVADPFLETIRAWRQEGAASPGS
jgi:pyruvate,orthophosphate dikinase